MNDDITQKIQAIEEKIDAIYVSVEKTRKYFQITLWVTVILFVLPLVALIFVVPAAMTSYMGGIDESSLELLK